MKKGLAVVLAALMMLSATTFLAAESPVNNDVEVKTEGVTIDENAGVTMTPTVVKTIFSQPTTKTTVKADDVTPVAVFVIDDSSVMPADKKVTFAVEGVTATDKVVALHFYDGVWVERAAEVVNGEVVVNFGDATHFSPIIIAKVAPQQWQIWGSHEIPVDGTTAAPEATLPKTGAVAVLPVAAMACLAGAVVCGRKEK